MIDEHLKVITLRIMMTFPFVSIFEIFAEKAYYF